jgi:alanine-glyoxylate transaminase / serine-glyoxylate transaminase / serine-pyruvate transaminase
MVACCSAARSGLRRLGFKLLAEPEHASDTVTAAWLPEGLAWPSFNAALRERGLVVAGGQGKLTGQIMRIGHLGAVQPTEVEEAVEIIGQVLTTVELPARAGAVRAGA